MDTITFYSYKGGTGRTLAVANSARFLASSGYNVFVLDLDLEAPGLHYKLGIRKTSSEIPIFGLVDFLYTYRTTGARPAIEPYVHSITDVVGPGRINLMPAGDAPSAKYSKTLAEVRIQELFNTADPTTAAFAIRIFTELKASIQSIYNPDYLLIDSRTGVTEIGSVAVRVLPDTVVCIIHNNDENKTGARKVLQSVGATVRSDRSDPITTILVVARLPPMPSRDEEALLSNIRNFFSEPIGTQSASRLAIGPVLVLHSDPDLQRAERIRIDEQTTANDSVLLRDYLKLFARLDFYGRLSPNKKAVVQELISTNRTATTTPGLVGGPDGPRFGFSAVNMQHRINTRHTLKVIPPTYMTGSAYSTFVEKILERLLSTLNVTRDRIEPKNVHWDLLAEHVREGVFDYFGDVYFLTDSRAHLVDIIQLGSCSTFTSVLRADSPIVSHIATTYGDTFQQQMNKLIDDHPGLAVGVLGDTPAASEVNRNLSSKLAGTSLIAKGSEDDLLKWLDESNVTQPKLSICDHVVAKRILEAAATRSKPSPYVSRFSFNFEFPVPIGVVYPREDRLWRKVLAKAIAYSLSDLLSTTAFRWNGGTGVTADLAIAKIQLLPLPELRSSLLADLTLDDGAKWYEIMNEVTGS